MRERGTNPLISEFPGRQLHTLHQSPAPLVIRTPQMTKLHQHHHKNVHSYMTILLCKDKMQSLLNIWQVSNGNERAFDKILYIIYMHTKTFNVHTKIIRERTQSWKLFPCAHQAVNSTDLYKTMSCDHKAQWRFGFTAPQRLPPIVHGAIFMEVSQIRRQSGSWDRSDLIVVIA